MGEKGMKINVRHGGRKIIKPTEDRKETTADRRPKTAAAEGDKKDK